MINNVLYKITQTPNVQEYEEHELKEAYEEIFSGLADILLASSFITALKLKGETADDIVSSILVARDKIKRINIVQDENNSIENIVLSPKNDVLDISFAVDVICCANEVNCLKYSIPLLKNPSFETLKAFGIKFNQDKSLNEIQDDFELNNLMYLNLLDNSSYIKYTLELSRKLPYDSILTYTNAMLNPFDVKNCSIAVFKKDLVEKFANVCLKTGYHNSVVYSGEDMSYITPYGESYVAEAWKNKIFAYKLTPVDLGFEEFEPDCLKVESSNESAEIINSVFLNKIQNAQFCAIVLNSALSLYITKKVSSIMEGVELAKQTIESNRAYEFLEKLKKNFKN